MADLERLPASARRLRAPDPLRACFSAGVERLAAESDRRWRGGPVDTVQGR